MNGERAPFFAVSTYKLLCMTLGSLGFYIPFWFYMHWSRIEEREHRSLLPLLRAIFAIPFVYFLFRRFADAQREHHAGEPLAAGLWAIVLIVLNLLASTLMMQAGAWPLLGILLSLLEVVPLLVAQAAINQHNQLLVPGHDRNDRLTPANRLVLLIGGVFWLMMAWSLLSGQLPVSSLGQSGFAGLK
ncbi:hypothetical protein [Leeia sp.]|uniref:hypothetical protein n=1 Tax=Leeia sp. TaxID=2884678 RepID=UPI0035AE5693